MKHSILLDEGDRSGYAAASIKDTALPIEGESGFGKEPWTGLHLPSSTVNKIYFKRIFATPILRSTAVEDGVLPAQDRLLLNSLINKR